MPPIDVTSLQNTAIKYQKELLWLPMIGLEDSLRYLNLVPGIQFQRKVTTFERERGILKPHTGEMNKLENVGKTKTRTLQVYPGDVVVEDYPENYRTVAYGPDTLLGKNKNKKHPWELVMLRAIMESVSEDLNLGLFVSERDEVVLDAYHVFDGFDKIYADEVIAGNIAVEHGNLWESPATVPVQGNGDDVPGYLFNFWKAAPLELRRAKTFMYVPYWMYEEYNEQVMYSSLPLSSIWGGVRSEIDKPWIKNLMGTEGRCVLAPMIGKQDSSLVILTDTKNLEIGVDQTSDQEFVQVRAVDNPFVVQFVLKLVFGTQYQSIHKKRFFSNAEAPAEIPAESSGSV